MILVSMTWKEQHAVVGKKKPTTAFYVDEIIYRNPRVALIYKPRRFIFRLIYNVEKVYKQASKQLW